MTNLQASINSDDLLKNVFDHLPEVCFCVGKDSELRHINANGKKLIGLDDNELHNKSLFDIFPKLTAKRWHTATQNAREKGQWIIQVEQPPSEGKPVYVELSLSHQLISGEDVFICIAKSTSTVDESARLLNFVAEATAGHAGQAFYESMMEHMASVMHVDHAFITECLDRPPSRVRMLAFWSCGKFVDNMEYDLIGTPCDTVINGRTNFHVEKDLGDVYPKEKGFGKSYFGVPIYDSENQHVIGHMAFLNNSDMSEDGLDCAAFEILASRAAVELQRSRAEQALRENEEKYRLLVENQTDLLMQMDHEARLKFVSPSCFSRLEKTEAELLDTDFRNFVHPEEIDRFNSIRQKALSDSNEHNCEQRIMTSKGWCWYTWSIKGVTDDNGNINEIIAVGRDISKLRNAEDRVRKTIQQLAHVGRLSSMGEMASGIAHELNQPLTAILSFAQASQRMLEAGTVDLEQYKSILTRIAANAENAGEIIRRIRKFVRKGELEKTPIDIGILLGEVKSLLSTELRHCDVMFSFNVEKGLPCIYGDSIQIQQVLVNLIHNAIEAIYDHNMQLREIHVSATHKSPAIVTMEIRDTGPGIPKEFQKQLFDTFTTTKNYGMGIGLSICHTIIENHGGKLSMQTRKNQGTTFRFSLPSVKQGEKQ